MHIKCSTVFFLYFLHNGEDENRDDNNNDKIPSIVNCIIRLIPTPFVCTHPNRTMKKKMGKCIDILQMRYYFAIR